MYRQKVTLCVVAALLVLMATQGALAEWFDDNTLKLVWPGWGYDGSGTLTYSISIRGMASGDTLSVADDIEHMGKDVEHAWPVTVYETEGTIVSLYGITTPSGFVAVCRCTAYVDVPPEPGGCWLVDID